MADVTIRKLDDWVVETHRTMLRPQQEFVREVRALQKKLGEKYGVMPDSTPLVREDRDRRG